MNKKTGQLVCQYLEYASIDALTKYKKPLKKYLRRRHWGLCFV